MSAWTSESCRWDRTTWNRSFFATDLLRPDDLSANYTPCCAKADSQYCGPSQCSGTMVAGNSAVYAISKAAIMPFTHSLALQSTDMSIRVNAVLQ